METGHKPIQGRGYALGWGTFSYRNMKALAHSGDQQGASAIILLIPEKRLGVTILANSENVDVDALAREIVDVVVTKPSLMRQKH